MNWLKALSAVALLLLLIPIAVLLFYGLGPYRAPEGLGMAMLRSILLTLVSSALAVAVAVLVFTPLSFHLARGSGRLADALVDIPVSVPHPIIGVALLILDSPETPTGRLLLGVGINFYNTLPGLVAALVIMSAPIYVRTMQQYFEARDQSPEDFGLGLGASRLRVLYSIVLPDSAAGVASASLLSMSRAMSEFGSISIIAYYVLQYPFYGVSAASVTIFQLFSGAIPGGLNAAVTASAIMILVALPIAMAGHLLRRKNHD